MPYAGQAALILRVGGGTNVGRYGTFPHLLTVYAAPSPIASCMRSSDPVRSFSESPIIATTSLKNAAFLKPLGATNVVDRTLPYDATHAALPALTAGSEAPPSHMRTSTTRSAGPTTGVSRTAQTVLAPGGGFTPTNASAR